jgi:hypothetical protein
MIIIQFSSTRTGWRIHRLRVLENRVLRRIFGPKREAGEHCVMRSFKTCTLDHTLLG